MHQPPRPILLHFCIVAALELQRASFQLNCICINIALSAAIAIKISRGRRACCAGGRSRALAARENSIVVDRMVPKNFHPIDFQNTRLKTRVAQTREKTHSPKNTPRLKTRVGGNSCDKKEKKSRKKGSFKSRVGKLKNNHVKKETSSRVWAKTKKITTKNNFSISVKQDSHFFFCTFISPSK